MVQPERTLVLDLPSHSGKGGAVRLAMLRRTTGCPSTTSAIGTPIGNAAEASDAMWQLAQARRAACWSGSRVRRLGATIDRRHCAIISERVRAFASLILSCRPTIRSAAPS